MHTVDLSLEISLARILHRQSAVAHAPRSGIGESNGVHARLVRLR